MQSVILRQADKFPEPEFTRLRRSVFADLEVNSTELATPLLDEAASAPLTRQVHSPIFRIGAYSSGDLVGWSFGWMERGGVYYMASSGVIASHRRQGIYTSLLGAVRAHAVSEGAATIRSQHSVLNSPVLIAKMRTGFIVSGLSQSAQMGTLVELTLHLSQKREDMYRNRVLPYVAPDA